MLSRRDVLLGLSGFALAPPAAIAAGGPERMLDFFSGRVVGEGVFSDLRKGKTRSVKAVLNGRKGTNSLILTQDMAFSDGQKEHRVWTFTSSGGRILGRRADLIGDADIDVGDASAHIAYTARTSVEGSTYSLKFDETLAFQGQKSASSMVRIKLLFIPVAEMTLSLRKVG